jgi:outer membrane immunogenic protein
MLIFVGRLGAIMKKLATCAVAVTGLLGTSAFAADMAVKGPPVPPPVPVYNWTGWYVGVNAGASLGDAETDIHDATTVTTAVHVIGLPALGPFFGGNTIGFGNHDQGQPNGFMGGGQIGYNWQYSPLIVVGVEADFQGALERDHFTRTDNFSGIDVRVPITSSSFFPATAAGSRALDFHSEIDWFGTVRARAGYVWGNGNVMSYLTGGLAYGEVKINGTSIASGTITGNPFPGFSVTESFSQSHMNTGWVAGYGTEAVIDFWGLHNWTWKIEGLWMDLGSVDATGTGIGPTTTTGGIGCLVGRTCTFSTGASGQTTTHTHFTDGILRAGLNYKFY